MKVLFVCTGNTCRSPMAEGIFNSLSEGAESRGLFATGARVSENAIKAMEKLGIDISAHISTRLTFADLEESELVLTMTKAHKDAIVSIVPSMDEKVFTLGEYVGGDDVSDPFGSDEAVYETCAKQLYEYIEKVVEKLNDNKKM